jgi:hypothetical protein
VIFDGTFFLVNLYVWACTYFFSFIVICTHLSKMSHNNWCSLHYVCIMWKKLIEITSGLKMDILLNVLLMYFSFWLKIILIYVLIIWLSFVHFIIAMKHKPYDINPRIPLQTCFKWHMYVSFKKEQKIPEIQNLHILSNYLNNKQKIK